MARLPLTFGVFLISSSPLWAATPSQKPKDFVLAQCQGPSNKVNLVLTTNADITEPLFITAQNLTTERDSIPGVRYDVGEVVMLGKTSSLAHSMSLISISDGNAESPKGFLLQWGESFPKSKQPGLEKSGSVQVVTEDPQFNTIRECELVANQSLLRKFSFFPETSLSSHALAPVPAPAPSPNLADTTKTFKIAECGQGDRQFKVYLKTNLDETKALEITAEGFKNAPAKSISRMSIAKGNAPWKHVFALIETSGPHSTNDTQGYDLQWKPIKGGGEIRVLTGDPRDTPETHECRRIDHRSLLLKLAEHRTPEEVTSDFNSLTSESH